MRIDLFGKYKLYCPNCGGRYDSRDGFFKCILDDCHGCELITPDEFEKRCKYYDIWLYDRGTELRCSKCGAYYDRSEGRSKCKIDGAKLVEPHKYIPPDNGNSGGFVTCPYCGFSAVKKLNQLDYAFTLRPARMFNQWHCKKCGSDF